MIFKKILSEEIFWPAGHFFGSGVVVSQNSILIGLQGTLYDPLECWEAIGKVLKIQTSTLDKFGLMSAFLAFMALGVKFLQLAEFLGQNGPHKAKVLIPILIHYGKVLTSIFFKCVFICNYAVTNQS